MSDTPESTIQLDAVEVALILLSYREPDFHHVMDIYYLFKEREAGDGKPHRPDEPSEAVWMFLDVFGGQEIKVPTRSDIEECIRHVQVYIAYRKVGMMDLNSPEKNDAYRRIWKGFDLESRKDMMSIVSDVESALDQLPDRTEVSDVAESDLDDSEDAEFKVQDTTMSGVTIGG